MKVICMFDLPMDTPKEKRDYTIFRKELIRNGFSMLQYSIYVRTCPNREYSKKFQKKLLKFSPPSGNVRLLSVTEKQYDDMFFIVGKRNLQEELIGTKRLVVL